MSSPVTDKHTVEGPRLSVILGLIYEVAMERRQFTPFNGGRDASDVLTVDSVEKLDVLVLYSSRVSIRF